MGQALPPSAEDVSWHEFALLMDLRRVGEMRRCRGAHPGANGLLAVMYVTLSCTM